MRSIENYAKRYLSQEVKEIKSRAGAEECNLTIYEKAIIYNYSDFGYEKVNEILRKSEGKIRSDYAELLDKCLDKLPDFEGLVYRCVDLTNLELEIYADCNKEDKPVVEHSFISTSKSVLTANAFGKNTRFVIYSKTGKEIEKFAKFGIDNSSNEKEVLFKSGRTFNVLEVTKEGSYTLITLEEA